MLARASVGPDSLGSVVHDLIRQYELLRSERSNWDHMWQDIHDIVAPHSSNFTRTQFPGARRNDQIYDTTNALALEKFGAVLESLLTPRQQLFHFFKASDDDLNKEKEVQLFFEQLNNNIFKTRRRPRSGYYDQFFESHKSLGMYGNQCMHTIPSKDGLGLSYRSIHIGAMWIDVDDRGVVDSFFYKWTMTAKAAIQKWGKEAPKAARDAVTQMDSFRPLEFLHVVAPRRFVRSEVLGSESMPWESWEISLDDQALIPVLNPVTGKLEESGGYIVPPYNYSRFSTNASEKHGRGPSMLVMGDNETLQRMERSSLLYGEHAVAAPLLSQSNDLLSDGTSNLDLRSGAVNPGWLDARGEPRVKALDNKFNWQVSEGLMEKKRNAINDAHFITLFQILVQTPEMTATEALIRAQEKGQLIAPMVGRQQSESLGPMVERELSLLPVVGLMPELPELLKEAEGEYEIEYSSSATRIQREEEVQGIRATYVDIAGIAELDPTVVEMLDGPASVRFIAQARGVPPFLIRSEKEFDDILAAQAERSEHQELLANAASVASTAKDASAAGIDISQ